MRSPLRSATLTIKFRFPVDHTVSRSITATTVSFFVTDIQRNANQFDVLLDAYGEVFIVSIAVFVDYTDDEGDFPDLTFLVGLVVGIDVCAARMLPLTLAPSHRYLAPSGMKSQGPSSTS